MSRVLERLKNACRSGVAKVAAAAGCALLLGGGAAAQSLPQVSDQAANGASAAGTWPEWIDKEQLLAAVHAAAPKPVEPDAVEGQAGASSRRYFQLVVMAPPETGPASPVVAVFYLPKPSAESVFQCVNHGVGIDSPGPKVRTFAAENTKRDFPENAVAGLFNAINGDLIVTAVGPVAVANALADVYGEIATTHVFGIPVSHELARLTGMGGRITCGVRGGTDTTGALGSVPQLELAAPTREPELP